MKESEKDFRKNGFRVVRSVIEPEEVPKLRETLNRAFKKLREENKKGRMLPPSTCFEIPEVAALLARPKMVATLKDLLGDDYKTIPDLTVHRNLFGMAQTRIFGIPIPNRFGWHIDANSEGKRAIHCDKNYRFLKCGIYLQDNHPQFGGGIDIIPGSHRFPLRTGIWQFDHRTRTLAAKFKILGKIKRVQLNAGDGVVFHSFLQHASSLDEKQRLTASEYDNQNYTHEVPEENTKFVIYFNASKSPFAEDFMQHSERRADKEFGDLNQQEGEIFFTDYTRENFPRLSPRIKNELRSIQLATPASSNHGEQRRAKLLESGNLNNVFA